MKNRRADSKHELGRKLLNTGRHSENTKRTNCPLSGGSTVFYANLRIVVVDGWHPFSFRSPTRNWQKFNCVSYIHWVAQLAPTFCTFQRMPSQSGMSTKSFYPGEENVFTIIVIHNYLRNTKRESNVEGSLSFRIPCHKVRSINASQ